jgi:hypothetical protein
MLFIGIYVVLLGRDWSRKFIWWEQEHSHCVLTREKYYQVFKILYS